jgi:hypothetical protein
MASRSLYGSDDDCARKQHLCDRVEDKLTRPKRHSRSYSSAPTLIQVLEQATRSWQASLRLLIILSTATAISVIGVIIIITSLSHIKGSATWALPVASIAGSALLTLATEAVRLVTRRRLSIAARQEDIHRNRQLEAADQFIRSMLTLERAVGATVGAEVNEPPEAIPLGISLRTLEDLAIWSDDDVERFRKLLRTRNLLVHDHKTVDVQTLQASMQESQRLIGGLLDVVTDKQAGAISADDMNA